MKKSTDSLKWFLLAKVAREFKPAYVRPFANFALFQCTHAVERLTPIKFIRHRFLRPVALMVQVGKLCNFNCSFCFVNELNTRGAKEYDFTPLKFEAILNHNLLNSLLRIGFTGGEPFVHRGIFDYFEIAKRRVPVISVNTNFALAGKVFKGERCVDRINKSPLDMITISLYENNVTEISEYAPQLNKRIFRRLGFIVSRGGDPFHNFRRMPQITEFAIKHGFQNIFFMNFDTMEGVTAKQANLNKMDVSGFVPITRDEAYLRVRDQVIKEYGQEISLTLPVQKSTPTDFHQSFNCYQPDFQIGIDAMANLSPCCELDRSAEYGNLYTHDNWNNSTFQKIRAGIKLRSAIPEPYCANCTYLQANFHDL